MDLDAFRWLLTEPGQLVLDRAERAFGEAGEDPLRAAAALRRTTTAEHAAAALTQVQLRRRARPKFGDRGTAMYFTPDGLEQATAPRVAEHRAARLRAAGALSVIDLGCGIGGDLLAVSAAGLVAAGVDLDPVRVAVAEANLGALGLAGAVTVADATRVDTSPFDVAFADPSRRTARGRSFSTDDWQPPWSFAEALLAGAACVKAAPGLPHDLVPDGVEAEWVSEHGEVKETCLWGGALAASRRRATVIGDGGLVTLTDEDETVDDVRPVGRYLYEPDGAVIRAGLVTAVAAGVRGGRLDPHLAYLTSDESFRTPFARGYRVVEVLPFRERALRAALRARDVGALTIKKRGVAVVPEELRKRLALSGDRPATVVLTRVAGRGAALLVEPF